ncbi:hypothetical protein ACFL04_04000 [Patescibacteria group bacterium]
MITKGSRRKVRIIWTVIVIIGVFAMILFTVLPALYGNNPY